MTPSILLTDSCDPDLASVAARTPGGRTEVRPSAELAAAMGELRGVMAVVVASSDPDVVHAVAERGRLYRVPVIMACESEEGCRLAGEVHADEWYTLPASVDEIERRLRTATLRVRAAEIAEANRLERVAFESLLFDSRTRMPTLPVMIERTRAIIKERGELVIFYLDFIRFAKIEEIYGWEKLDDVLASTAGAVRDFISREKLGDMRMMLGFTHDDDFIFFYIPERDRRSASDQEITEVAQRLHRFVGMRLEDEHGEDVAALFDIFVGSAHVYHNPKVRLERLIYRGVREAAHTARSIEQRQRARKVTDLRRLLHDRSLYVEYHPIFSAETGRIFGYEALARGVARTLRSPEVMFEVAADADLVWELSRLCRARAVEGAPERLGDGQLLFLNADPHDFTDPTFGEFDSMDPHRVVIEITERTAITDYPAFRERLNALRARGFRFAVDDAGSGYAGLGSIANLEPDFIKLDISLIKSIETNFIKQNLVETMVGFAREQGAMVIAEGIESAAELDTVKRLGVPLVQGFFLQPPAGQRGNEQGKNGDRAAARAAARRIRQAGTQVRRRK
ncbi:MAG TPA: EAL domain-containing protein [Gemmatimonadaceae bacterium]|nr:EAL domain-containing protein [Gemmatimonadaceae bacterium]